MRLIFLVFISVAAALATRETRQLCVSIEPEAAPTMAKASDATEVAAVISAAHTSMAVVAADGKAPYGPSCQMCHQASGAGLPNAFPSVKGILLIANVPDPVPHGYNARPKYGIIPVYTANLTGEKVAAVATCVRNAWGNSGTAIKADFERKLRKISQPVIL